MSEPTAENLPAAPDPAILARARLRMHGPMPVGPDAPAHAGLRQVPGHDERTWLLAGSPDGALPSLLEEYDLAPAPVERAGETRRVLAAVLRCCWVELDAHPWPGGAASIAAVSAVFADISRGDAELLGRWARGALRRLHDSSWVLLDERLGSVRLGPRIAAWPDASLGPLRELLHQLPLPERPAVTELPVETTDE